MYWAGIYRKEKAHYIKKQQMKLQIKSKDKIILKSGEPGKKIKAKAR